MVSLASRGKNRENDERASFVIIGRFFFCSDISRAKNTGATFGAKRNMAGRTENYLVRNSEQVHITV